MAPTKRKRAASGSKNTTNKKVKKSEKESKLIKSEDKSSDIEEQKPDAKVVDKLKSPKASKNNGKSKKKKSENNNIKEENENSTTSDTEVEDEQVDDKGDNIVGKKISKKNIKGEPVPRPIKYESLGEGPQPVVATGKMYVGCHVSVAGGVFNAFKNAEECSASSFALFLRNQRQWVAKPLEDTIIEKWMKTMGDMAPHLILPHGSYLMNLGSPNTEALEKSRAMLLDEIQRCERLGIPHYNFHPGSSLGKITREECCKLIAESINLVSKETKGVVFVLENMSYQGFTVGGDFHELRTIIEHVDDRSRVGVCLDTCHAHAAGYDLGTEEGFLKMTGDFEKIVGWQFLRALHINDSKGKAGDHLDRHEIIGKGTIGIKGFKRIMNFKHFQDIPIILETPWTSNEGYAKEIKILQGLIS